MGRPPNEGSSAVQRFRRERRVNRLSWRRDRSNWRPHAAWCWLAPSKTDLPDLMGRDTAGLRGKCIRPMKLTRVLPSILLRGQTTRSQTGVKNGGYQQGAGSIPVASPAVRARPSASRSSSLLPGAGYR
jgi:hypothetical protein